MIHRWTLPLRLARIHAKSAARRAWLAAQAKVSLPVSRHSAKGKQAGQA